MSMIHEYIIIIKERVLSMELRSYLEKLNTGEKILLGGALLAVLSLFMKWVDIGFASVNGFQQDGYLILAAFIYPVLKAVKSEAPSKKISLFSLGVGIAFMIYFIADKSVDLFGTTVNMASTGMYVMMGALIIAMAGAYLNNR